MISDLCWEPSSLYLASAGGEDRHVRLWHNVPGMKQLIIDLEAKLPKASSEPLKVCFCSELYWNIINFFLVETCSGTDERNQVMVILFHILNIHLIFLA